jgi:phosphate/sulfate permease
MSLRSQLGVATGMAGAVVIVVYFGLVPHITKQLSVCQSSSSQLDTSSLDMSMRSDSSFGGDMDRSSNPLVVSPALSPVVKKSDNKETAPAMSDVNFCFQYLLLCVAALESFAHGANDTANSTAAFR